MYRVNWRESVAPNQVTINVKDKDNDSSQNDTVDLSFNDEKITFALLSLKKPTVIKKIIDSIPMPANAVPENGLPTWYRLDPEYKLPVPKFPAGKIVFSRGEVGENIHQPHSLNTPGLTFSVLRNDITFEYSPLHDPHLVNHFNRLSIRKKMKEHGMITEDGKAVCSLKEFNEFRKYLNNQYKNHIKAVVKEMDEKAREDLILKRVEEDQARRRKRLLDSEKTRTRLQKLAQWNVDQWEEKKRIAKERQKRAKERLLHVALMNEKKRKELAARAKEKGNRVKQRQEFVKELDIQNNILKMKDARLKEQKRLAWLKQEKIAKAKKQEEEENAKWEARLEAENKKIMEEEFLLKIYSDNIAAGAARRAKKAENKAYEMDLQLQRIRLTNIKIVHGEENKKIAIAKRMTDRYKKSIRFKSYAVTEEVAEQIANDSMYSAMSINSDRFVTFAQARTLMYKHAELPSCVVQLIDQIIESAVIEFARRRMVSMLYDVENNVYKIYIKIFFASLSTNNMKKQELYNIYANFNKRSKKPRWIVPKSDTKKEEAQNFQYIQSYHVKYDNDPTIRRLSTEITNELQSVKNRTPTPAASFEKIAKISFKDPVDFLPDATIVAIDSRLPERKKMIEMIKAAGKLLSRLVKQHVEKGMDTLLGEIALPSVKRRLEYGEVVEILTHAVVENRIHSGSVDIQHAVIFLAYRILLSMIEEKRARKRREAKSSFSNGREPQDFYRPTKITSMI